jgi:hypothetical protein
MMIKRSNEFHTGPARSLASGCQRGLLDGKLVDAANQIGNGRERDRVVGEIGDGVLGRQNVSLRDEIAAWG